MCELRFGSWTYNQRQLNFSYYDETERRVTIKDYVVSGSWDLMDGPMSIQQSSNETNSTVEKTYRRDRVEFVCKLVIRRKTLFYTVNLIIPTVDEHRADLRPRSLCLGPDLLPVDLRFLSPDRGGGKDDSVHFDLTRPGGVSLADLENPSSDLDSDSSDRQVSPLHLHHEHHHHLLHRGDHQLQLSHAANEQNALLDATIVHRHLTENSLHGTSAQVRERRGRATNEAEVDHVPSSDANPVDRHAHVESSPILVGGGRRRRRRGERDGSRLKQRNL